MVSKFIKDLPHSIKDTNEFMKQYICDFVGEAYGKDSKGQPCCTPDGHTKNPPKWFSSRLHGRKYKQQLRCTECGRPLSDWEESEHGK